MDSLIDALTLHGPKVLFFVLVGLIARWGYRWLSTRDERALEEQLREALAAGDHRAAGDLQVRRGLLREASRIYERGGEHARAGRALLKLGEEKAAADAFERAGEHAQAAALFRKLGEPMRAAEQLERSAARADKLLAAECFREAGEHLRAARLLQDAEEYEKAADAFAAVDKLEAFGYSLTMLENAALAVPPEGGRRKELWRRAGEVAQKLGQHEKAAKAFDEAGELARAAGVYENALKQFDMAAALHAELDDAASVERLTLAAGGSERVLARRAERARARGDGALALSLKTELDAATRKLSPEEIVGATALAGPSPLAPGAGVAGPAAAAEPPPTGPEERFELLSELGRGGMGVVHKARDRRLDRLVALKFLPPDLDPGSPLFRMFQREARAAAAHSHPGIVTIYDIGTLDGREFIAMELVEGTTLDEALAAEGPLPPLKALDVFERVLEAVEYAHGKNIIHRDLKPSNLMRTKTGIKVMDFGLAKIVGAKMTGQQTMIAGTPAYMPPEQLTGRTDFRSDLFALGATFYELLTGVLPGLPQRPANLAMGYPSVRDRVPNVPRRLSDVIMRCLDVEPDNRPASATEVLREVREVRIAINAVAQELRAFADASTPMPQKEIIVPPAPSRPKHSPRAFPAASPPAAKGGIVEIVEQRGPRGRDDR
ncbi:MAG: protein kinase [Myxococcales bacterium]|nr:protein kinase [Myxococcales bacterium]MBL0194601.1 protein kinase [Myxococcales bacterium]